MSKSIGNIAHAERRLGGGRQHQGVFKISNAPAPASPLCDWH